MIRYTNHSTWLQCRDNTNFMRGTLRRGPAERSDVKEIVFQIRMAAPERSKFNVLVATSNDLGKCGRWPPILHQTPRCMPCHSPIYMGVQ